MHSSRYRSYRVAEQIDKKSSERKYSVRIRERVADSIQGAGPQVNFVARSQLLSRYSTFLKNINL